MKKIPKPKSVDEYIASVPKEAQGKLKELRKAIIQSAPQAEERISYGMPYYHYKGRLAYFRLASNHIGLYVPPPILENFKKELADYETTVSALHLSLDKKLPIPLIKNLIKARMKKNDEKK